MTDNRHYYAGLGVSLTSIISDEDLVRMQKNPRTFPAWGLRMVIEELQFLRKVAGESSSVYPTDECGCGYPLIYTEEGWQHDAAPYLWGDDHDPDVDDVAKAAALEWDREHNDDCCNRCGLDPFRREPVSEPQEELSDNGLCLECRKIIAACEHRADDYPDGGDVCRDCGIPLTWTGPSTYDYEPAMGWEPDLEKYVSSYGDGSPEVNIDGDPVKDCGS